MKIDANKVFEALGIEENQKPAIEVLVDLTKNHSQIYAEYVNHLVDAINDPKKEDEAKSQLRDALGKAIGYVGNTYVSR